MEGAESVVLEISAGDYDIIAGSAEVMIADSNHAPEWSATPITGADLPLLACDVWEHAYYLDRHNARADYLEAFWKVVDWEAAGKRLR